MVGRFLKWTRATFWQTREEGRGTAACAFTAVLTQRKLREAPLPRASDMGQEFFFGILKETYCH